ncbi:MAG: hypothetical protein E6H09_15840 [Bacteroidetes bacterium]|jgi:SecD/SecF fusion protein|nr:MAG: hypothetical protein E6H09_15840 [Bacteroidota bacterium]
MNTWLKSLLIGTVVAGIAFVVFERMSKKRTLQYFTVHYELERAAAPGTGPSSHDETVVELHKMSQVLQTRCKNAGYPIEVKDLANGEKLDVTIQEISDTARVQKLITRIGKLEIREVYTVEELASLNASARKETEPVSIEAVPADDTVIDTGKAIKFSAQEPKPVKKVEPAPSFESIFTSSQQPDGAEIGSVAEKDTAAFREIFKKELLRLLPANARFYYGPNLTSTMTKKSNLGVYVIRVNNRGSILIDNSDIKAAMQDFGPSGDPTVAFSFTSIGSRKWGMLTGNNVGRPLAILVDDIVVSAPKVESAILGGKAIISGGFFVSEALALADQLNSGAMPARFHIIKQEISQESSGINLKALLIILVAFAIGTGTSYLIFKLLKSN